MTPSSQITVLYPKREESLAAFEVRISEAAGELLVLLSDFESMMVRDKDALESFLEKCRSMSGRLRIATRKKRIARAARARGIRIIERTQDLRKLLSGHPDLQDALREFQLHVWRQQLRSRLQSIGLLSLPKLRIWVLILMSGILFSFVFFRLLPSSTIRVWPREETVSQTVNIFLVQSGSTAEIPSRVRSLELRPIVVRVDRTITFDQISKDFIGENAKVAMTLINESDEDYWLRKGSRLMNQAGMTFRLQESVKIPTKGEALVEAVADPEDLYGEIVGDRGNVPEGLRWDFVALPPEEQRVVYGVNRTPATGGRSAYRSVVKPQDLEIARKKLEQELLTIGKQLVEEERDLFNSQHSDKLLEILYYEELTKTQYVDFVLSEQFIGQSVNSIPIEGSIIYTAYAYDTQHVLNVLKEELVAHTGNQKRLLVDTLTFDRLIAHVIDYADDLSWIKLTVDLSGTEQHVLDPLSPTGAVFGRKVREAVVGLSKEEALRVVANFPEVERAEISLWPPWTRSLPVIPAHISIEPVTE